MIRTLTLAILLTYCNSLTAQNKEAAEKLVGEGVALHDKGEYDAALAKYEEALKQDENNLLALAEKSMSLMYSSRYEEALSVCEKAVEVHKGNETLLSVYVTYGSCLNRLKRTDEALDIFDEGIKLFPNFHLLYFNKAVALSGISRTDDAILNLQRSVQLNPKHASSHNALARLLYFQNKRVPAILAYGAFFMLEPNGQRAKENLGILKEMLGAGVEKTGKKSVTISLDPNLLADTTKDGKPNENSFAITDMILTMSSALDYDKKNKKKSEVELFKEKFETLCSSVEEQQANNHGFYWSYYVPYYIEMKKQGLVEPFAYIVYATSGEKEVEKWLNDHEKEVRKFYTWAANYDWGKN